VQAPTKFNFSINLKATKALDLVLPNTQLVGADEVIEYPYPHSEISMRELFLVSQGRMWYASSVNNKVGYFYFNDDADAAAGK
jgi:hypothetical protein